MQLHGNLAVETADSATLKSRFGEISYNPAKTLNFPNGILGLPDQKRFAVAGFPDKRMERFQVLQSLVENEVAFCILPHELMAEKIDAEDIEEVRKVLDVQASDFLVVLIVSIHRTPSGSRLSVNMRAPLFVDVARKVGYQIVLANSKYKVQHYL